MKSRRNPAGYASLTRDRARQLLGLDPSATKEQARKSFLALAKGHHPDVGGDAALFSMISEAYDVMMGDLIPVGESPRTSTASAPRARPTEQPAQASIRIFDAPSRGQVYVSLMGGRAISLTSNARELALEILGHLNMMLDDAFESGGRYGVEISVKTLNRPVRTNLATMMYDIFVGNVDVLRVDMGSSFEDEMPEWDDE